jgi:hypothetical protein
MRLNDESRYWLEQESATGNETARQTLQDVVDMERHVERLEFWKRSFVWFDLLFVVWCCVVAAVCLTVLVL